jgi:hypothetical protein
MPTLEATAAIHVISQLPVKISITWSLVVADKEDVNARLPSA